MAKNTTLAKSAKSVTPAQIKEWWPADRAKRILAIMRDDGISYSRAVKRSRRRMISEMG